MHRRRKNQVGITLVELMVVLAIVGVVVASALPAMGGAMADRRVAALAREVVQVYRHAQYSAQAYGRAHLVRYESDLTALGLLQQTFYFETIRSDKGSCPLTEIFLDPTVPSVPAFDCSNQPKCVNSLYASEYDSNPNDNMEIRVGSYGNFSLCYQSSGGNHLYYHNPAFLWRFAQPGVLFRVYRARNVTETVGVNRKVFVPFGVGAARIAR